MTPQARKKKNLLGDLKRATKVYAKALEAERAAFAKRRKILDELVELGVRDFILGDRKYVYDPGLGWMSVPYPPPSPPETGV